ncbi:FadR/GntR family transcriptional regulator [Paeniglutamicibacter psychrophenolicus]|uniref:FadR/GntR family transcriptional regulator n=1 Tax=Paeniglutamicibacter psychrophenolicus TaxID=257454 RepID=UPI00277EE94A|nr:FCD domain-containing protein [Paeniglutamicibacter psychrophenolicus]MDQ0093446.1 DNA-binding FadR family transcriptional regulator [Paeniglutamicibacter psychrophenolicus]
MPKSLHQRAIEHVGSRIVDGSIPAGEVILAAELESELGVSRSVIREAVRVLASAGLVVSTKRVGIRVLGPEDWNPFDPLVIRWRLAGGGQGAQLRSLTELRVAVEPMAAELAAEHAPAEFCGELLNLAARMRHAGRSGDLGSFLELDIRFHAMVLAASGNEMFANLANPIAETLRGRTELGLMPERPHEEALAWHQAVADAISAHEPHLARESMELIMRRTNQEICGVWAHAPRLFPQPRA